MRIDTTGSTDEVAVLRDRARAQRVVIDDLNHRMKNLLTVVQAMAMQSFREDRPLDTSMAAFGRRLRALARAQDLLLVPPSAPVALRQVVADVVAPHDPDHSRVDIAGPALAIDPDTAVQLAMTLHELLTNAVKYGALSTRAGRVAIGWSFDPARPAGIRLEWREHGGPCVAAPARHGFGTGFIEKLAACPGAPALRFDPGGVCATFDLPAAPSG